MIRMDCNRTNPVERDKVPSQRSTNGTDMDSPRRSAVAEIRHTEITKVEHEQEQRQPVVRVREEAHKAEQKQVVGNKVATEVGG